jgi:hypothetical protein
MRYIFCSMCGIAGIIGRLDERNRAALERMSDALVHRGPDGLDPVAVERLRRAFLDQAPGMYWSRVWSVYVFIRWCHQNRVFR